MLPAPALVVLHWFPAAMLVGAIARWPYGYYMLLRVVVCVAAALLAFEIYQRGKGFTIWCALFLATAVMFNPLIPIHMTRGIWGILNLAAAALFAAHFFVARSEQQST